MKTAWEREAESVWNILIETEDSEDGNGIQTA